MKDLRVHIVPIGLDPRERITDPLIQYRADRAYLMSHLKDSAIASENLESAKRILGKKLPSCELRQLSIDIWDLFACLEQYRKIFQSESENRVYVNTSTGSKIACISGMLACMIWNGIPYYAKLDYSKQNPTKIKSMEVNETIELPKYKLLMPEERSLTVLSVIRKSGGRITKKALIEELQELKLIPTYDDNHRSAPHSRLRPILDPLESNWGFVQVKARGRKSEVTLTEQGTTALRIFGESQ
jgi:Domain of unknown function (DUF6293)/DUF6293 C-terminal winged helix domain